MNLLRVWTSRGVLMGLILGVLALPGIASAGPYGLFTWTAKVAYTNGATHHIKTFTEPTCQAAYNLALAYPPAGAAVDYSNTYGCTAMFFEFPVLVELPPWFKWDPDPCLVCGVLTDDLTALIYPRDYEVVTRLKEEFGIQQYQAELAELNARYDLAGFQEQMGQLEQEILQH